MINCHEKSGADLIAELGSDAGAGLSFAAAEERV